MDENLDFGSLEQEFCVTLPAEYKAFLLNYPKFLSRIKRDYGWKQESAADRELVASMERLRQLNHIVRMPNTPWMWDDGPWPENHFVIGDNEAGDYWSLDVNREQSGVFFYDHDSGRMVERFGSLDEFAAFFD